jgi:hypothetical protein
MYRCSRCGTTKPLEAFTWNRVKRRPDTYCRPCRAEYGREHYLKNKQLYVDKAGARTRRVIEERTRFILEYFETHPCVDCGEDDPLVLEFDHRGDKSFEVAYAVRNRGWQQVLDEIEKCDVRCANCHRRRTAINRGFMRALMAKQGPRPCIPEQLVFDDGSE